MSRKHLVFGTDVVESNSIPSSFAEPDLVSDSATEQSVPGSLRNDAAYFPLPAPSRGQENEIVPEASEESWQPKKPPIRQPLESDELVRPASGDHTLLAIVAFVGAVLSLFVLNQSLVFVHHLAQLPEWAQWVGWTALVCALAAIVGSVWSLTQRYRHLKQTPSLWLDRQELRELAGAGTLVAKRRLEEFLHEYSIDLNRPLKWNRLGLTTDALQSLADARTDLLNPRHGHTNIWLEELNDRFLRLLDETAQQRVTHYAKRVGLKTAVAPTGFLDSTIVIVNSYLLLADLCDIYNVRAGRLGTVRLLIRVAFNTSIAAKLEYPADLLEQEIRDSFFDMTNKLVAQALGKIIAKAAEGSANALLIFRLGQATIRELRPLRLK